MVDQMAVGAAARAIAPNAWAILERCAPGSATHREIEPEVIRSVELAKAAIEAYEAAKNAAQGAGDARQAAREDKSGAS